ncbi:MAG: spore coat protein [Omnitrophica WOR_2 bacterium GWF2_38_59]|nr:MAG: spore coat protein [Omnitrophica WOR_2 bacterium GWF2_38_59]OGX48280.1 MAG: spore coat protein [Omnitrophica WOR_2 bacterium RIFOXYA2_FULL_38_17]OGX54863.1 MAG: spore coat protein [Omnitrophica WOR_2 bacterium RIFOXYA12_FULL_38_10]OGX59556.1 MAG: spore coat protein [Omnitrophica WOR_2 bacterium RIFOXYC2_FULL_38_12]OGX59947.1 MAG: spore coat protein [Omnitrophica WOR_2 bacterium RIFOXYB2_FULL_38_16]
MKGVLLAGGSAQRLRPLTKVTNKHLLPVYKKPMIYYPLETLLNAGIKDILIVTGGEHIGHFFNLLGTGKEWGARFSYEIQEGSGGTGAALLLAEKFVNDREFMVILGDNVVSENVGRFVDDFKKDKERFKAKVLIAKVNDPEKYGVVTFKGKKIVDIVEKPKKPKSNYVNTGLWMFLPEVFTLLKNLKKSPRGEYEVTDVLSHYVKNDQLSYSILKSQWTDAGSFESLYKATVLMKKLEDKEMQKKKAKK